MSKVIVLPLFIVSLVLAIAVPIWVTSEDKSGATTIGLGGLVLTAEAGKGRVLFAERCAVCHALRAAGTEGATGPNLDIHVGEQTNTYAGKKELVLSAIAEGRHEGEGIMPSHLYVGREAEQVADFVAQAANADKGEKGQ